MMRKRRLTQQFLHAAAPLAEENGKISATNFAKALSKFAGEHLSGALTVECFGESDGIISISPRLAAHAIKTMLSYAKPDELLELKISIDSIMDMEIIFDELPSAEHLAKIFNLAKAYGFEVARAERSITLSAGIKVSEVFHIYAVSADDFETELFNIFCK